MISDGRHPFLKRQEKGKLPGQDKWAVSMALRKADTCHRTCLGARRLHCFYLRGKGQASILPIGQILQFIIFNQLTLLRKVRDGSFKRSQLYHDYPASISVQPKLISAEGYPRSQPWTWCGHCWPPDLSSLPPHRMPRHRVLKTKMWTHGVVGGGTWAPQAHNNPDLVIHTSGGKIEKLFLQSR